LYDVLVTHSLEWPSLTVEWIPNGNIKYSGNTIQRKIIYGS